MKTTYVGRLFGPKSMATNLSDAIVTAVPFGRWAQCLADLVCSQSRQACELSPTPCLVSGVSLGNSFAQVTIQADGAILGDAETEEAAMPPSSSSFFP